MAYTFFPHEKSLIISRKAYISMDDNFLKKIESKTFRIEYQTYNASTLNLIKQERNQWLGLFQNSGSVVFCRILELFEVIYYLVRVGGWAGVAVFVFQPNDTKMCRVPKNACSLKKTTTNASRV